MQEGSSWGMRRFGMRRAGAHGFSCAWKTLLCVALLGASPAFARGESESGTAEAIASAEASGRMVHTHYRAIEVVREAMHADRTMRRDRRVAEWSTLGYGGQIHVAVLDETSAAIYRAVVSSDGALVAPVEALTAPTVLSEPERDAAQARRTALALDASRCGTDYEAVSLPSSVSGQWVVYLFPRPARGVVRLGGSSRVETEGDAVTAWRPYTRTCIALDPGDNAGAMVVTHLLDPTPTDMHVFWSLWRGMTLYVTTSETGLWKIESGRISAVKD